MEHVGEPSALITTSPLPSPVELIAEHAHADQHTVPTGAILFRRSEPVQAIYALERGLVELSAPGAGRLRYGAGEVFFYEDLAGNRLHHSRDARALTPVAFVRLPRISFLELVHRHPTMVLSLLERQHSRLREQRLDACHFY
jgi:CRP/FNR family cyclic AMP-dependent transcriptional regulator